MKKRIGINVVGALFAALLVTAASPAESPVADAAERGDLAAVTQLLRQGADANAPQGDGMTALHWAAKNGQPEMAGVLLYAGANPDATTRLGGFTPLHMASKIGHVGVIKALLEQGADAEASTSTGARPLHMAAASGNAEAVSALLARGVEVDAREIANEQTPLMWAAAQNRVAAMTALIEAGADLSLKSKVIDYAKLSEMDGPERRRREAIVAATNDPFPSDDEDDGPARDRQAAQQQGQGQRAQGAQPQEEPRDSAAAPAAAAAQAPAAGGAAARGGAGQDEPDDQAVPKAQPNDSAAAQPPDDDDDSRRGGGGGGGNDQPLGYDDLVGLEGGLTALHYAARDGHAEAAMLLIEHGADINEVAGDGTSPLLIATINGNYDLAMQFLEHGADPNLESEDGVAPLFATLNNRWAPKALFPQPTAFKQQRTTYLQMAEALLKAGADVNHRTKRHVWYTSFNFDLLGVDFTGATPFWRAAYATDVPAMQLLISYGADPNIPTAKAPSRRRRGGGGDEDPSGLPPVPTGGPSVYPIHAASGAGYGTSRAGNSHRHVPNGWIPAVKYLVEELGADVNVRDEGGYSAVHHAAARGDNELIMYLVSKGANVSYVSRRGQTTVDMANGPQQRVQPFPETIALLEGLGAKNNHNCQSC
jgi:ankyrin repeat protein